MSNSFSMMNLIAESSVCHTVTARSESIVLTLLCCVGVTAVPYERVGR
jgi:hypothetical protein